MNKTDFLSFTAGNVVTIATLIIGAAMLWQKMKDEIKGFGSRMTTQEADMKELTKIAVVTTLQQHERRITTLEDAASSISEIRTDLKWIKQALAKIDEHQQLH